MTKKITSWSATKLACYQACPRQAKFRYIDKLPEEKAEALERGIKIHELAEKYVRGEGEHPAPELALIRKELAYYRKKYAADEAFVEVDIFFDKDWNRLTDVPPYDGRIWLRTKADVILFDGDKAKVVDFKTGKVKKENEAYDDQLALYALSVLLARPDIVSCTASLLFVDAGREIERPSGTLTREDIPSSIAFWQDKIGPMLADELFPPRPNFTCRWCQWRKENGGPCEFGSK